jgi:hypothetical protein
MTIQDSGVPAICQDGNDIHYYVPPPPRPAGTSIPDFGQAITVAQHGATAYQSGHDGATTVENDWTIVETIIANQYGIAWTSSDPEAAVAALDRQYAGYLQDNGTASRIYNEVVAAAKGTVQGETTDQRKAQVQPDEAYNEPASLTAEATAAEATDEGAVAKQADINAMLQAKYGKGDDRVYTVAQIEAAIAALDQQGPAVAPLVNFLAANVEEGRALKDVLAVLRTKGSKLTPAETKSGNLGAIRLTPAEIKFGTLALTPAAARLAVDPVTLAFLKANGGTVTQPSPQMVQVAKESPSLFACVELNGVNVSVEAPKVGRLVPTPGRTVYNLSNRSEATIPPADAVPAVTTDGNGAPSTTSGLPAVISRLEASMTVYSGIATSLDWRMEGLEFAGCGFGAVQWRNPLCWLNARRGDMSPGEGIQAVAAVAQGTLPYVMEPIVRGIGRAVKARFGRADTRVSPTAVDLKVQPGAWPLDPEGGFLWWTADGTDGGEVTPDGAPVRAYEPEPPPAGGS